MLTALPDLTLGEGVAWWGSGETAASGSEGALVRVAGQAAGSEGTLLEAGRYAGCVKGDLWKPPVNGKSRMPYGPSASASVELICEAERKEEGSTSLKGGGVEQWRLSKMALDTHLLNVQLSMVSHLCK